VNVIEGKWLLGKIVPYPILLLAPHGRVAVGVIITIRFAVLGLILLSEVCTTRFVAVKGV